MKTYLSFLIAVMLLQLAACQRDSARTFLPGTYTNAAEGKYSRANDTLIVEASESNQFLLHRRTGFNIISNGKTGKRQHETEEWTSTYADETKTLIENRKGKVISIYPEAGYIIIGKRRYTKK